MEETFGEFTRASKPDRRMEGLRLEEGARQKDRGGGGGKGLGP